MRFFLIFFSLFFTISLCDMGSGLCMQELFGGMPMVSCGASDVAVTELFVVGNQTIFCVENEDVVVHVRARIVSQATERFDIGVVIASDGGDGETGECVNFNLSPTSADNMDLNLLGGFGPFYNGEIGLNDTCGDIRSADGDNIVDLGNITVKCVDNNMDGLVDVNGGVSWDNQASMGTEMSPHCNGPDEAKPGTSSKCRIEMLDINGMFCDTTIILMDDMAMTLKNTSVTLNVTQNDIFNQFGPDFNSLSIISGPSNGSVMLLGDGEVKYTPDEMFLGNDTFVYEICNTCEPPLCKNATVVIVVKDEETSTTTTVGTTTTVMNTTTVGTTTTTGGTTVSPTTTTTTTTTTSPVTIFSTNGRLSPGQVVGIVFGSLFIFFLILWCCFPRSHCHYFNPFHPHPHDYATTYVIFNPFDDTAILTETFIRRISVLEKSSINERYKNK